MSDSHGVAGPPEEAQEDALPIDPEIAALLEFEPVPRKVKRKDGWFPHLQREFVHRLALCGSPGEVARQMRKNVSGIEAIYREEGADSFRAAWDGALELAWKREAQQRGGGFEGRAPGINVRGSASPGRARGEGWDDDEPLPGQVRNEYGEWEDAGSLAERQEEARDRIGEKLRRARRLYLSEIVESPGKRAAFEILTELPIDWDKARNLEPQADEPWRRPNMRTGDMLLTAENGWLGGVTHGPDKVAELQRAMNEHLIAEGREPVDWEAEQDEAF